MPRIELLQAGRGLAAIAVVLCHAGIYDGHRLGSEYGSFGPDFFFLISGFIIYRVTTDRPFSLADFAWKRARRIYLPYLPIGALMALAYAAAGRDFSPLASLTLLPGETALHPAWSLQNELAFYALAAAFFSLRIPLIGATIWAAVILAASVDPAATGTWQTVLLSPRNLMFVAGMFAGRFVTIPRVKVGPALLLLGDASYSIYLVHLPVMAILWRLGAGFWPLTGAGVVAGLAYYQWAEKPLLRLVSASTPFATRASRASPDAPNVAAPSGAPAATYNS